MIASKLTFCAEGVIRDVTTNKISAFNIFEDISSMSFPLLISKFCVLNALVRDKKSRS